MSPEELAEIEARLKAAQGDDGTLALTADEYGYVWYADGDGDACMYVGGSLGLGINGSELARLLAHAPTDIAALLSEVRRLTPAPKVARAPAAKVAVWGPVRGTWGIPALRVNKRIKAHYSGRDGSWWAYTNGVAHARRVNSEAEARAHIEAWAKAKGWEVRDA